MGIVQSENVKDFGISDVFNLIRGINRTAITRRERSAALRKMRESGIRSAEIAGQKEERGNGCLFSTPWIPNRQH